MSRGFMCHGDRYADTNHIHHGTQRRFVSFFSEIRGRFELNTNKQK
jgi:hypothetical protein